MFIANRYATNKRSVFKLERLTPLFYLFLDYILRRIFILTNNSLFDICDKKHKKLITESWEDLAKRFDFSTGESLRCWFKRERKKLGLLNEIQEKKLKILHISDFHFPFTLPKETFKDYINKVDILVLNGDLLDCQSLSKFVKKYRIPFIDELIGARKYFIDLINYIKPKKVIVNYGNHCLRLLNSLDNNLSNELMAIMPKSSSSLLFDLGFWNHDHKNKTKTFYESIKKVFENKIKIDYTDNWYCRIGNALFAHPSAFRQGILKTTEQAYLYFLQQGQEFFDVIILAHTHRIGFSKYNKTFLYESGCCCDEMDYLDGKLVKPQDRGFLYLVQKNGNFVYDESKLICLK